MEKAEILVEDLRRLAVQTGHLSEACLGCGFEHNCSVHGCQVLQQAADMIEELNQFDRSQSYRLMDRLEQMLEVLRASEAARTELAKRLAHAEKALHEARSEVRCRDCIYMHDRGKGAVVCDRMNYAAVTEEGGCSWGERRPR